MSRTSWDEDITRDKLYTHDEEALRSLSAQYGKLLYSLAKRITGSESDAEECVNDALLDLWRQVPPARPVHLLAFTCSLVRRRAIDRVRYNTAQQRVGSDYAVSLDELSECLSSPEGKSELDTLAIRYAIQSFLDMLDPMDRTIFLLRYYQFESNTQIAVACGLRETTVVCG